MPPRRAGKNVPAWFRWSRPAASLGRPSKSGRKAVQALVCGFVLLACVLGSWGSAHAGSSFKVGSFTKIASGSNQVVTHSLGETPKALIMWTGGNINDEAFHADFRFAYGLTDQDRTSLSVATASEDGQSTSDASRRMANKAITIVRWSETLRAEADVTAWTTTTFTLDWTTNSTTTQYLIHYLIIGGSDIQAKVKNWTMKTSTGNLAVTGIGFQPDVVLHAHAGANFTSALPGSIAHATVGLGVMDADGDEWANFVASQDNASTTDTVRNQQTDACIYAIDFPRNITKEASWVSMDNDGFTVNFSTASSHASQTISLALKGLNVKAGIFTKTTAAAPVAQAVSGVSFQPDALLLASFQRDPAINDGHSDLALGLGASDGTNESSSYVHDDTNETTSNADSIDKTSKVFMVVDNKDDIMDAEADLQSLDSDGFTLNWTTNHSDDTEIGYLAFSSLSATAVRLRSFEAVERETGVELRWATGWEVDNLGFHLYRGPAGERERVTPELLAGSALLAGAGTRLPAGQSYGWLDPEGLRTDLYWLVDVDLSGKRTWHGPVSVQPARASMTDAVQTLVLSQLNAAAPSAPLPDRGQPAPVLPANRGQYKVQRALANMPTVKLFVREEGWYRVGYAELVAAGLSPGVDPRKLRLFADGQEQALLVRDGGNGSSGRFDPDDSIEFYGQGVDTAWTDTRVYWLMEARRRGRRVKGYASRPARPQEATSFPVTVVDPAHEVYFAALKNGPADNFFGPVLSAEPVERTLTLQAVADAEAQLTLTLQGVTETAHEVAVSLNDIAIGTLTFTGQQQGSLTAPIPPAWLHEGTNTLTLTATGGAEDVNEVSEVSDVSLLAALQLTYGHAYTAAGDTLRFTAQGQRQIWLEGFTSPAIRVVDITNPHRVEEVTGPISPTGAGYGVTVRVRRAGTRQLLAFTEAGIYHPLAMEANTPSRWYRAQGTEVVVLSHADFLDSLTPWRALRESQGWSVAILDVADVYDEFSFGRKDPQALKDFLQVAHEHWPQPPTHVLLVGDASFDPRNYLGLGHTDFVPTRLVDTTFLETAWDDWLGDFADSGRTPLAIGRLPVRTSAEADRLIAKLVQYGQTHGPWQDRLLLVADNQEARDEKEATDFAGTSSEVEALVPPAVQVKRVVLGQHLNTTRAELLRQLNSGQLLVNYLGHGSVEVWAGEGLLTADDVRGLHNGPRLPVVVTLNCLNGFFHGVYTESLAEAWLKAPHGGAIAVWASSGLTAARGQAALDQALITELFSGEGLTLGQAIQQAKATVRPLDLRRTWILFGDPTLRVW